MDELSVVSVETRLLPVLNICELSWLLLLHMPMQDVKKRAGQLRIDLFSVFDYYLERR